MIVSEVLQKTNQLKAIDFTKELRTEFSPDLSIQMKSVLQEADLSKTFVERFLWFFINENYAVYEFLPLKPKESEDGLKAYRLTGASGSFFCVLTDPRLKAGTFSNLSLDYFHRFLDHISLQPANIPFVFGLNSAGVRLTQTRDMFYRIWGTGV